MIARGLALSLPFLLGGCLYANVEQPLSYRSPTPVDVPAQTITTDVANGEACNHVILYLVAYGDGGYRSAMNDALEKSKGKLLVDVKADSNFMNVLGVYQRTCTRVRGHVVK